MLRFSNKWGYVLAGLAIAMMLSLASDRAADLNPTAIKYVTADQLKWTTNPDNGALTAILQGDPTKPGPYITLTKWTPHHMSHPHFHPNDRFIMVISGTW